MKRKVDKMKGIVIVTHGKLCEGYLDSAKLFFKDDLKQLLTCSLEMDSKLDEFSEQIINSCKSADTGEGVVVLVDLVGGTPCNTVLKLLLEKKLENVKVLAGLNFPMFLDLLGQRMVGTYDFDGLLKVGKDGVTEVKLPNENEDDEEII